MEANVIVFTGRQPKPTTRPIPRQSGNNVISLAGWFGKAIPRRTPNGVYFTTHVLATSTSGSAA